MDEAAMKRKGKIRKGFACMDPDELRKWSAQGGRACHALGKAHEWTAVEASEAGKKGGATTSLDREHMSRAGRKGGSSPHRPRRPKEPVLAEQEAVVDPVFAAGQALHCQCGQSWIQHALHLGSPPYPCEARDGCECTHFVAAP
jgi:uncharacterized protein